MFPEGSCGCGAGLAGAADLGVRYSRQVTDLPEAQAQTTQYDRHEVRCACGRVHLADVPPRAGAPGTVTYGLNVRAWCVFLMVMHHVPVERCADILESMSGTRPSDGRVHTLPSRGRGSGSARSPAWTAAPAPASSPRDRRRASRLGRRLPGSIAGCRSARTAAPSRRTGRRRRPARTRRSRPRPSRGPGRQRAGQGRGPRAARPGQRPAVADIEELGHDPPVPGHQRGGWSHCRARDVTGSCQSSAETRP